MKKFFEELKKRNVYKVATAYLAASWLLIQVVSSIGSNFSITDNLKTIIYKALLIGFPVALILAWAFEFTPQGWKRTGEIQTESTENRRVATNLNRFIIAVLSVIVVFMLIDRFFLTGAKKFQDQEKQTLAILPFENLSGDTDYNYIGQGLAIEMRDLMVKHEDLLVIGESSVGVLNSKTESIADIAETLEINFLLKGGIRIGGDKIVINVELINTKNNIVLWSNRYDENLKDILAVQNEIAHKIINELEGKTDIGLFWTKRNEDKIEPLAYKKYLRTKTLLKYRVNRDSLELAAKLLEESIAEFPNHGGSQALMAVMIHYLALYGGQNDIRTQEDRIRRMREYIDNAKSIDPNLKEVYLAEGILAGQRESKNRDETTSKFTNQADYFRKALELDPGYSLASNWLYLMLKNSGKNEEARRVIEKAYLNDPLNPILAANWGRRLSDKGEYGAALEVLDKVIRHLPNSGIEIIKAELLLEYMGDQVGALKFFYPHYNAYKDDIRNLEMMLKIINALDMPPLADKYFKRLLFLKGSETEDAFWTIVFHNYQYGRYQEILDIFELEEFRTKNPRFSATATRHRASIHHIIGEYKKAKQILETAYPELKISTEGTRDFARNDWDRMWAAYIYSDLQRRNGQTDLAKYYANLACELGRNFEDPLQPDIFERARCDAISGNEAAMFNKLEELYMQGTSDALFTLDGIGFSAYKNHPRLKKLTAFVEKRIQNKREEAISYLKVQKEWDDNWNIEIGLE